MDGVVLVPYVLNGVDLEPGVAITVVDAKRAMLYAASTVSDSAKIKLKESACMASPNHAAGVDPTHTPAGPQVTRGVSKVMRVRNHRAEGAGNGR